jgi:hypothetical protein
MNRPPHPVPKHSINLAQAYVIPHSFVNVPSVLRQLYPFPTGPALTITLPNVAPTPFPSQPSGTSYVDSPRGVSTCVGVSLIYIYGKGRGGKEKGRTLSERVHPPSAISPVANASQLPSPSPLYWYTLLLQFGAPLGEVSGEQELQ